MMQIPSEQCENCGRAIGNLEVPMLWNVGVVCSGCYDLPWSDSNPPFLTIRRLSFAVAIVTASVGVLLATLLLLGTPRSQNSVAKYTIITVPPPAPAASPRPVIISKIKDIAGKKTQGSTQPNGPVTTQPGPLKPLRMENAKGTQFKLKVALISRSANGTTAQPPSAMIRPIVAESNKLRAISAAPASPPMISLTPLPDPQPLPGPSGLSAAFVYRLAMFQPVVDSNGNIFGSNGSYVWEIERTTNRVIVLIPAGNLHFDSTICCGIKGNIYILANKMGGNSVVELLQISSITRLRRTMAKLAVGGPVLPQAGMIIEGPHGVMFVALNNTEPRWGPAGKTISKIFAVQPNGDTKTIAKFKRHKIVSLNRTGDEVFGVASQGTDYKGRPLNCKLFSARSNGHLTTLMRFQPFGWNTKNLPHLGVLPSEMLMPGSLLLPLAKGPGGDFYGLSILHTATGIGKIALAFRYSVKTKRFRIIARFSGAAADMPQAFAVAGDGAMVFEIPGGPFGFGRLEQAAPGRPLTTVLNFSGPIGVFPYGGLFSVCGGVAGFTRAGGPAGTGTAFFLSASGQIVVAALPSFSGNSQEFAAMRFNLPHPVVAAGASQIYYEPTAWWGRPACTFYVIGIRTPHLGSLVAAASSGISPVVKARPQKNTAGERSAKHADASAASEQISLRKVFTIGTQKDFKVFFSAGKPILAIAKKLYSAAGSRVMEVDLKTKHVRIIADLKPWIILNSGLFSGPKGLIYGLAYRPFPNPIDPGTATELFKIDPTTGISSSTVIAKNDCKIPPLCTAICDPVDGTIYVAHNELSPKTRAEVIAIPRHDAPRVLLAFKGHRPGGTISGLRCVAGALLGVSSFTGEYRNGAIFSVGLHRPIQPIKSFKEAGWLRNDYPHIGKLPPSEPLPGILSSEGLLLGHDGRVFGLTELQTPTDGTLAWAFQFSPRTRMFRIIARFGGAFGPVPYGFTIDPEGNPVFVCPGGSFGFGELLEINQKKPNIILHFSPPIGVFPLGRMISLKAGILGLTSAGGLNGCGTIFFLDNKSSMITAAFEDRTRPWDMVIPDGIQGAYLLQHSIHGADGSLLEISVNTPNGAIRPNKPLPIKPGVPPAPVAFAKLPNCRYWLKLALKSAALLPRPRPNQSIALQSKVAMRDEILYYVARRYALSGHPKRANAILHLLLASATRDFRKMSGPNGGWNRKWLPSLLLAINADAGNWRMVLKIAAHNQDLAFEAVRMIANLGHLHNAQQLALSISDVNTRAEAVNSVTEAALLQKNRALAQANLAWVQGIEQQLYFGPGAYEDGYPALLQAAEEAERLGDISAARAFISDAIDQATRNPQTFPGLSDQNSRIFGTIQTLGYVLSTLRYQDAGIGKWAREAVWSKFMEELRKLPAEYRLGTLLYILFERCEPKRVGEVILRALELASEVKQWKVWYINYIDNRNVGPNGTVCKWQLSLETDDAVYCKCALEEFAAGNAELAIAMCDKITNPDVRATAYRQIDAGWSPSSYEAPDYYDFWSRLACVGAPFNCSLRRYYGEIKSTLRHLQGKPWGKSIIQSTDVYELVSNSPKAIETIMALPLPQSDSNLTFLAARLLAKRHEYPQSINFLQSLPVESSAAAYGIYRLAYQEVKDGHSEEASHNMLGISDPFLRAVFALGAAAATEKQKNLARHKSKLIFKPTFEPVGAHLVNIGD
ncbi:MAG: hypothetical protein HKL96_13620 [Phycisphaerales bacterium]|nr:hypothetical protein [Phycisphaerales bacterium]